MKFMITIPQSTVLRSFPGVYGKIISILVSFIRVIINQWFLKYNKNVIIINKQK